MNLKTLANGRPGSGKSYFVLTHPKVAWCITEPGSEILLETHPDLAKNVVMWESFVPSPAEDIKDTFNRMDTFVKKAHELQAKGEVETLALDNVSYLSENRWLFINKYQKEVTGKGALDVRSMYGTLGRYLYQEILTNFLSFKGNVVVTVHEMDEEFEQDGKMVKTGKIISNILGGFREKVAGMFGANIFLEVRRTGNDQYVYRAVCKPTPRKEAKNRYGLPEIVENISYDSIVQSIKGGK